MSRDDAPEAIADRICGELKSHETELRASGIVRLGLFGSTARGMATPASDIDLLAAFDAARPISFLDMIGIENTLSDLLGRRVDLIEEGTLKPGIRRNADRETIRIF